jgi:hypothetical protein
VLGEGRGVRSEEAESKMCDFGEVGNVRFQLIREFQDVNVKANLTTGL